MIEAHARGIEDDPTRVPRVRVEGWRARAAAGRDAR